MKEAKALLEKYKAGICTQEEMRLIDKWLLEIHIGERSDLSAEDFEQIGQEVWNGVLANRMNGVGSNRSSARTARLWTRVAGIAAAVAAITLGVWFYANEIASVPRNDEVVRNDIAPGKNGATITLDNGKVIQLSDAKEGIVMDASEISYTDGTNISSSLRDEVKQSQLVMAATSRGQTYQVVLPDGTRVWLNADTKISFPSQFIGRQRKVLLTNGEAYFEVTKNKAKPFIVESPASNGRPGQQVTVLGTHFNINSYADEGVTKTTLLEGSVSVSSLLSSRAIAKDLGPTGLGTTNVRGPSKLGMTGSLGEATILKPGQQSVLTDSRPIKVIEVDPSEAVAWKNGLFIFDSETLESIMVEVARWYNVDIIYQDQQVGKQVFSGSVSRFNNVSSVLSKLEKTGPVRFKIEGRTITVQSTK